MTYAPSAGASQDNRFKKRLLILIGVIVVVAGLVITQMFLGTHDKNSFAVTGTIPTLGNLNTLSTSLAISFNKPILEKSVSITSSPAIVSSTSVTGKVLNIQFMPNKLSDATRYTITLTTISDTSGKRLTDQTFSFKPSFQPPTTVGEDSLYAVGLTTDQVNAINNYISGFKPWALNVSIDTSTVNHYRNINDGGWGPSHVNFSMSIDGTNYNAVTNYLGVSAIQLQLLDPASGTQVYEAGSASDQ